MPKFSETSIKRLGTCDWRLISICGNVIRDFDFTIIQGHRTPEEHAQYLAEGKTKVPYERSKHSRSPSLAVDIAPWPIDWNDIRRFDLLAGRMLQQAYMQGIKLRWGGDWDGDSNLKDQTFNDLVHFEIKE